MLNHPDLLATLVKRRQDDLTAEAAHTRLLQLAREWRRSCGTGHVNGSSRTEARIAAPSAGAITGTLAACGPHVAGSAR